MNPGDILDGRYEIVARLGAGGMGEVYKATHTLLGASRVIKVVHPHIATNSDAKDRFLREAKVATKVQHQNVAALHDFAALPDGAHYMVWEFIEGENLAQRLRARGTLPPRQAVRIAIDALHGLEAIHRAGIVHRDISPENLMITPDGAIKIIDLGVAKLDDPDAVSQTRTGIFVGKLRYAAPEQLGFLPEDQKIDGRADLYALAMTVVELLTGRPPYEAKSPHEYFLHHAREIPTTTVELPAELPGSSALQQVLQKALARNRDERFASARDFANALEEIEKTLPDPVSTATVATPVDLDATWRPSDAGRETVRTPAPSAHEVTLQTPLPAPPVVPVADATVETPMPPAAPPPPQPRQRSLLIPLLAVAAFVFVAAVAGGAYVFWPKISQAFSPKSETLKEPVAIAKKADAVRPSESTVSVTPATSAATVTMTPVTPVITPPPPVKVATKTQPVESRTDTVASQIQVPFDDQPVRPQRPSTYIEAPGRHRGNDRALDRLRAELRGVKEVSLVAGTMQVPVYRALHRYIPNLTFDAEAPVVIRWDATRDRLGYDRKHLAASATIEKDGKVIFRYDASAYLDAETAADAFAQTISEAFEE